MKKFINFRYPFYCFLALLFGAGIAKSLYAADVEAIVVVAIALLFVAIISLCYKKFLPLLMIVIFFFAGNGTFFLGMQFFDNSSFQGEVAVVGRVSDQSFVKEDSYASIVLENVSINGQSSKNLRLFVSGESGFDIGDSLAFEAEVETIKPYNLGVFNLSSYRNGVGYSSSVSGSELVITPGQMNIDEEFRYKVKTALLQNMEEENAYIAYAVLFGDQSMIDENVSEVYRNSGIVHVLTVSGLHISFIVGALMLLLKLFRSNKFVNLIIIALVLLCYCYLCGFTPSVVRATVMALVLCLSRICNRPYDGLNSLAIAGFVIVLFSPLSTVDVGFLMSFFCVMFILLLAKPFTRVLSHVMPKKIAQLTAVSVAAQIGILPFTASFFSTFNFLSVFANLLIIPIFSLIFPIMFVMAFLVVIMPFIAPLFSVFDFFLNLVFAIASFFASTSLQVPLKPFSVSISVLIVVFFFTLSSFYVLKPPGRFLTVSIVSFVLCLSILLPNISINNFSSVSFVNSYQGQMIVFTSKEGDCLCYGDDYYYQTFSSLDQNYQVDFYLSENLSISDAQMWKEFGARVLLSPNADKADEDQVEIAAQPLQVGSFKVSYFQNAFTVEYDEQKILLAQNVSNSSLIDLINQNNYDIIFIGDNQFELPKSDAKIVSVSAQNGDFSFEENGNFSILFGENLSLRGLD